MKGQWKVSSNVISGAKMYIAYRLRDINAVDHSGNREYAGEYVPDREPVQALVDELNRQEENK